MSDEEIKKALECCISLSCEGCPLKDEHGCLTISDENALALINRQQAEIERLQNTLDDVLDSQLLLIERAEKYVIKEFAERLKTKAYLDNGLNGFLCSMVIDVDDIDTLLAELVGEKNETSN